MARKKPMQWSIKNDAQHLLPKFRKAIKILSNDYDIDDVVLETYENYKFYIDGCECLFFKMGKVSQVEFIKKTIIMLKELERKENKQ